MHIRSFQHETLKAYRKSPVGTDHSVLYNLTPNLNNAPTFSIFIYKRICLVCREMFSTECSTSLACGTESFGSRLRVRFKEAHWFVQAPKDFFGASIVWSSTHLLSSLLYFLCLPFHAAFAHIFCKILTDDYKFGYLHYILCSFQPIKTLMEEGKVININFFIITSKKRNILICV